MWGEGHRRNCPGCGQNVEHMRDVLGNRELRGPRNITSANVDRIFDDNGQRFLIIEEKNPHEKCSEGQRALLRALSRLNHVTVWFTQGTPDNLTVYEIRGDTRRRISTGTIDDYQHLVDAWFASPIDNLEEDIADLEWCHQAGADVTVRAAELQTVLTPFLHQSTTTKEH